MEGKKIGFAISEGCHFLYVAKKRPIIEGKWSKTKAQCFYSLALFN
jgi:hypothetical protein